MGECKGDCIGDLYGEWMGDLMGDLIGDRTGDFIGEPSGDFNFFSFLGSRALKWNTDHPHYCLAVTDSSKILQKISVETFFIFKFPTAG